IQQDLPVNVSYLPRNEVEKNPSLARLAKGLPEGIDVLRILKIGHVDEQADGGTHVKSTKEIGKLVLLRVENKGKGRKRVYFGLE
ncbi:alanyl-tRNA editing protein AlaX, partial [archaeon]|nr:alanyl-tRNA editing protein AlaX [archaeon]